MASGPFRAPSNVSLVLLEWQQAAVGNTHLGYALITCSHRFYQRKTELNRDLLVLCRKLLNAPGPNRKPLQPSLAGCRLEAQEPTLLLVLQSCCRVGSLLLLILKPLGQPPSPLPTSPISYLGRRLVGERLAVRATQGRLGQEEKGSPALRPLPSSSLPGKGHPPACSLSLSHTQTYFPFPNSSHFSIAEGEKGGGTGYGGLLHAWERLCWTMICSTDPGSP